MRAMELKYCLIFAILALYLWLLFQFHPFLVLAQVEPPKELTLPGYEEVSNILVKIIKNIPNTFITFLKESFKSIKNIWVWIYRNILSWFKDISISNKWLKKQIVLIKQEIAKEKKEFQQELKEGLTAVFRSFWYKIKQGIK